MFLDFALPVELPSVAARIGIEPTTQIEVARFIATVNIFFQRTEANIQLFLLKSSIFTLNLIQSFKHFICIIKNYFFTLSHSVAGTIIAID